jgi:hypothetical protein
MNIKNLNKSKELEKATALVELRLHGWILSRMFISGKLIYSRINKDGTPIIGVDVIEQIDTGVYSKHLEYAVINDRLVPTIPLRALCDSIG